MHSYYIIWTETGNYSNYIYIFTLSENFQHRLRQKHALSIQHFACALRFICNSIIYVRKKHEACCYREKKSVMVRPEAAQYKAEVLLTPRGFYSSYIRVLFIWLHFFYELLNDALYIWSMCSYIKCCGKSTKQVSSWLSLTI